MSNDGAWKELVCCKCVNDQIVTLIGDPFGVAKSDSLFQTIIAVNKFGRLKLFQLIFRENFFGKPSFFPQTLKISDKLCVDFSDDRRLLF